MAASDVRGECERPEADCVAVLEPVVDPHSRVPDDPDPDKGSERQDRVGVVATGGEGIGARFARPQFGTRRLLEHAQPAGMVRMRLRVQEHSDILDAEAEFRNARHDHRCGCGIAAIEHDVALGPGDEEGRGIRRANVVQVAGDAERFGGPLPASLCRIQPPAHEYQRKNTRQSYEDYQPISLGELGQPSLSQCEFAQPGLLLAT